MKNYIGSLLAMATMVAYSSASTNCTQPLEIRSHNHKILVKKYHCNQVVHNADLQMEPEIFYDAPLLQGYYTLFLLENNNNTGTYKVHWFLTDIIPMNKSLTTNKTIVEGYKPPMNNVTTPYTFIMYKHSHSLNLKSPSYTEMNNFIPHAWARYISNMTLENNATFYVTGRNTSHPHPSGPIHPHASTQSTHTHTSEAHTTNPTFQSPKTTSIQPHYVTHTVTEKTPGYYSYNSTNSNSTNHNTPSHSHKKNGASSIVCSFTITFIPLISVITKVIF